MLFIEEKPSFKVMHELQNEVDNVSCMISALMEEEDTVQRATDLYNAVLDLHRSVNNVCRLKEE